MYLYLFLFGEQINLFEFVLKMSLVSKVFDMSLATIHRTLIKSKHATIMDIGLGKGGFACGLLQYLDAQKDISLESIHVIGADIDPDSLDVAEKRVMELATTLKHFKVTFQKVHSYAEDLDWEQLSNSTRGDLCVVSNFTLHHLKQPHEHMQVGAANARDAFFAGLRRLNPKLVNIVEPDSNHISDNLQERLAFSLVHFRKVKEYIEAQDFGDGQYTNKGISSALINGFFGNELLDIVSGSDTDRTERHEPYYVWQSRFLKNGFHPEPVAFEDNGEHTLQIDTYPGLARFCFGGYPLLAFLSYSTPKPLVANLSQNIPHHGGSYPRMIGGLKGALIEHLVKTEGVPYNCTFGTDNVHVSAGSAKILSLLGGVVSNQPEAVLLTLDQDFPVLKSFSQGVVHEDLPWSRDFSMDIDSCRDRLHALLTQKKKPVVYFSTPHGITGGCADKLAVRDMVEAFPDVLFIIDECYNQYSEYTQSLIPTALCCENLVLVRSFSKDFGLAGERIGYMISHPKWTDQVQNKDFLRELIESSQQAALNALQSYDRIKDACQNVMHTRQELYVGLQKLGLDPIPSSANFVSFPHPHARDIDCLLEEEHGFRVAVRESEGHSMVRVTVPKQELLLPFLDALGCVLLHYTY